MENKVLVAVPFETGWIPSQRRRSERFVQSSTGESTGLSASSFFRSVPSNASNRRFCREGGKVVSVIFFATSLNRGKKWYVYSFLPVRLLLCDAVQVFTLFWECNFSLFLFLFLLRKRYSFLFYLSSFFVKEILSCLKNIDDPSLTNVKEYRENPRREENNANHSSTCDDVAFCFY